jgi:acylphosphatase
MKKSYRIQIEGMVQGVGFRFHARRQAHSLGISGWVKNQPDGSVWILAEGDPMNLEQFLAWCHEGPRSARVHHVSVQQEEPKDIDGFDIRF